MWQPAFRSKFPLRGSLHLRFSECPRNQLELCASGSTKLTFQALASNADCFSKLSWIHELWCRKFVSQYGMLNEQSSGMLLIFGSAELLITAGLHSKYHCLLWGQCAWILFLKADILLEIIGKFSLLEFLFLLNLRRQILLSGNNAIYSVILCISVVLSLFLVTGTKIS